MYHAGSLIKLVIEIHELRLVLKVGNWVTAFAGIVVVLDSDLVE